MAGKTKRKEVVTVDGWVRMEEEDERSSEKKSTKRMYWMRHR